MREPNRKESGAKARATGGCRKNGTRKHSRDKTKWAAQGIRYCLVLLGASLLSFAATGCSDDDASERVSGIEGARPESTLPIATSIFASDSASRSTQPVIVFLGTSLTAGYGLPESQAFPALIGSRVASAALDYRVINAGVSGDTSAGGLRRLDWLLRLPIAVLVLELGANDMLRGQSVKQLRSNLETILERTREAHPQVKFLIAGMRAAPNLGREYGRDFDAVYPSLAEHFEASLVPFLLEDVAADRQLNQPDGIHPTAEGHALIADRIWTRIEPMLQ